MRTVLTLSLLLTISLPAGTALAQVDAKTQRAWKAKCSACHGEDGKGQTDAGKKLGVTDMTVAAWQKNVTDAQIKESMEKGVKDKMPAITDLQPGQADALVKFVRGLAK